MVPHWVRRSEEGWYWISGSQKQQSLHVAALGGSIGTPAQGITAEIVEVKTWEQLKELNTQVRGKIVFFNRPMDRSLINPGAAYGKAVDQRGRGAIEAARWGAAAALVRSMSTRFDDVPHTGVMRYADTIPKIPSLAVSTNDANMIGALLAEGKKITVTLKASCEMLPDAPSANVLGEIVGTKKPNEVIVVGGHLDSWDKGQGAHDDGAGCIHAMEALRLINELGLKPKRTIRAVMFINEENGTRGGKAYADTIRGNEKHIAAIESDAGGFTPRGLGVADSSAYLKLLPFASIFRLIGADHINYGGGGVDIDPLSDKHVPCIGLQVDGQKYFDYHHSDNDTIDKVNERELALGAAMIAMTAYLIAQEGL
jgi:carboxypeptidase Q